jgi:hypothetical protein
LNETTLKRGFRVIFGETVFEFSLRCRVQHALALALIRDQRQPVARMAEAVGYSHQTSFATAFRRHFYVGRVDSYQAKQHEEMQAVADALSLLANLVMAWNTMKMQSVLDRWNARRSTAVPSGLIGRIAPTRTEGINLRGVFTFPIEQYQVQLLTSFPAVKSRAFGS